MTWPIKVAPDQPCPMCCGGKGPSLAAWFTLLNLCNIIGSEKKKSPLYPACPLRHALEATAKESLSKNTNRDAKQFLILGFKLHAGLLLRPFAKICECGLWKKKKKTRDGRERACLQARSFILPLKDVTCLQLARLNTSLLDLPLRTSQRKCQEPCSNWPQIVSRLSDCSLVNHPMGLVQTVLCLLLRIYWVRFSDSREESDPSPL